MKKIALIFSIILLIYSNKAFTQVKKVVVEDERTMLAYLNQTRITNKLGVWFDLHYRLAEDFVKDPWQLIIRPGITYYLSDQVRLTAGYAFVNLYPAGNRTISQPEHRPWQQIQWFGKHKGFNTMQYLRLEERYRKRIDDNRFVEGYSFNYRIRYNFFLSVPLKGTVITPKSFFFFIGDELHINFGKEIIYNYFDQNRAYIGMGYQIAANTNLQAGYLNLFQQSPNGNNYANSHVLRIFLSHNLDFRQKEGN